MISTIPLNGIEPVLAANHTGSGRDDAERLLLFEPGQRIGARVEARLSDGSFRVQVADREMRMTLPAGVAVGDTLELTFVAHQPQPTFSLQESVPQETPAPLLSSAGRLVAAIMPPRGEPAVLATSGTPLLSALPADVGVLSSALQTTVAQSGLFYEAHQAAWLDGKKSLAQLQIEPQARLARDPAGLTAAPADGAAPNIPAAAGATGASDARPMPPETLHLVQQQIAALESGKIQLQIEVWPRQWMQWEIEERSSDEPRAAQTREAPEGWRTRLRLVLPHLGELNAALVLGGNGVQIGIMASSADSAAQLHNHREALRAALGAAGLPPAGIAIAVNGGS